MHASMYIVAKNKDRVVWVLTYPKESDLQLNRGICTVGVNISLHLEIINLFNLEIKIAQLLREKGNEILYYLLGV